MAKSIYASDHQSEDKGEKAPTLLEDKKLVARAQEGDQQALEELVGRYHRKAYAVAYNMCFGDSEEAHDLTQEAFLKVFRSLKKFRGHSSFYTWFFRILVNTCLDRRRRLGRWKKIFSFWRPAQTTQNPPSEGYIEHPDMADHLNPMNALSAKELSREIQSALVSLPERQRLAFQLKVLHGMTISEIAEVMEAAEGTVKSHLFRATQFLREALKEWTEP